MIDLPSRLVDSTNADLILRNRKDPPPLFDCAEGEALDEFVLGGEAGDDHGE
jgi:hypothetical protein